MLRAILFDFNGVLVDDEPIHQELLARVLSEEGIDVPSDVLWELAVGRDDRSGLRALFSWSGVELSDVLLSRLVARKATYYRQQVEEEGLRPLPGILDLVAEAHAADLMLGVVTGALRSEVEDALRSLELRSAFKVVVAAEDVDVGKPDPQGYQKALRELNATPPLPERLLHPHEVVALEDSPSGVAAATGAGLFTVAVATTHRPEALTDADHVLRSAVGLDLRSLVEAGSG